jgi:serine/threonine protein kinase
MIGRGLKTSVDQKYFNGRVTVDKELFNGERYVYRVSKDGAFYILKGYQILLEHLKPGDEESRQRFINVLSAISEAYQEYFFSRIACLFNQHFAKPLEIDQEVELTSDINSLSYLYIEILFEYSGEPLNSFASITIDSTYNLMRQSANALSLLHNTGLMHLDIKPSNMMYNGKTDLLKMMDVGTSFGYGTHSIICKPTNTAKPRIREFTREFAPPEILKERYGFNIPIRKLLEGNVDVYCWGMCFYTMLLEKSVAALIHEANFYKLNTQEEYDKFMEATKAAMKRIETRSEMEGKKKDFILELIYEALNFIPQERPNICEIQRRMKAFERREKIEISYEKIEKDYEGKIMRMLMIGSEDKRGKRLADISLATEMSGKKNIEELNLKTMTGQKSGMSFIERKEQVSSVKNMKDNRSSYIDMEKKMADIGKTYNSMIEKSMKANKNLAQDIPPRKNIEGKKNPNAENNQNAYDSLIEFKNDRKDKNLQSNYFSNKSGDKGGNANYNSMITTDKASEPIDDESRKALQKFSEELTKMKTDFETKKKVKSEVKKSQPEVTRSAPKVEFLGAKIESHIDPRMNDPEYLKKQLEMISKLMLNL